MTLPIATYRLQLREGVDFDAAIAFLPHLSDLGISHLYLSPIFTATDGSTHGYDVIDPTEIDPALGGEVGFAKLSDAAQAAGIGIILDLVPNHTAFSLENAWLRDVLRLGRDSRYARHFDIDWDEGPLILPWLSETFAVHLAAGEVEKTADSLRVADLEIPRRGDVQTDDLDALHDNQHWRLAHWSRERDGVTHRRFFNVTGLIGMRVEDPEVFEDMHACVVSLIKAGRVQGVRLDHIDGLADPATYLRRLRAAIGDVPIWVEKILTGDEVLPDWSIAGTTGYEAATQIARLLTDAKGAARLTEAFVEQTGETQTFHEALLTAKADVIRRDLASELRRLITLSRRACDALTDIDVGDEALREAIIALLTAFPQYRTYLAGRDRPQADIDLMQTVAEEAAASLRDRAVIDLLTRMISAPQSRAETALQRRFQQVTGALLAKSHEDTAGFRWTPNLATSEVGADPDVPATTPSAFSEWANAQPGTGLLLTSSHDTKRSEDARMRLVAMSHLADDALSLIAEAADLTTEDDVAPNLRWYIVQSAIAIWGDTTGDLRNRLAEHTTKAMREADQYTSWTHPNENTEAAALAFLDGLIAAWSATTPAALDRIIALGNRLSLAQLALKMMLPGIPDIYRGCEGAHFALTDPDNRMAVDVAVLEDLHNADGLDGAKARLTRQMLGLHHADEALFRQGHTLVTRPTPDQLIIMRDYDGRQFSATIALKGDVKDENAAMITAALDDRIVIAADFSRADALA